MRSMPYTEYLTRPVPDSKRADLVGFFSTPETGERFLQTLDSIRKKHDISDWKKEVTKVVVEFEKDSTVSKHTLRDAVTEAMDYKSFEAVFGDISGQYEDFDAVPVVKTPETKRFARIEFDVDEFLGMNRYSRSLRYKPVEFTPEVRTQFSTGQRNFVNLEQRLLQTKLQEDRMQKLFRTPALDRTLNLFSNISRYAKHTAEKKALQKPSQLFSQAVAAAQRLFAEIARNPESYVRLTQSETSAMNTVKVTTSTNSSDPKAALQLVAITAMNQVYAAKTGINKIEEERVEHKKVPDTWLPTSGSKPLDERLTEMGFTEKEQQNLEPVFEKWPNLPGYIEDGLIGSREDLEDTLRSIEASSKTKQLSR